MARHESESIGQLLLDRGWISATQLDAALARKRDLGGRLGTSLLEIGVVSEHILVRTLTEQSGLPPANIDELRQVSREVLDLLPAKVAIQHQAVPFRTGRGHVDLAVAEEPEIPALDELGFVLGRKPVIHIASEARIHEALARHYGHKCPTRFSRLLERLDQVHAAQGPEELDAPPQLDPPPRRRLRTTGVDKVGTPPFAEVDLKPRSVPRPTTVPLSPDERNALRRFQDPDSIKPLSEQEVQRALQEARRANDIGVALLGFLGEEFLRVLVFRAGKEGVRGWMGHSPQLDEASFRQWKVGYDEPSVFLNLRQGAELFVGRLPAMPAHERLIGCWDGSIGTECAVFPVKVRNRLVCAVYGDRDSLGLGGLDVPAIQRLSAKAAIAFEMLLMQRKLRSG